MKTIILLKANHSYAQFFRFDGNGMRELESLTCPEARLRERDLQSDAPGRAYDRGGSGHHSLAQKTVLSRSLNWRS